MFKKIKNNKKYFNTHDNNIINFIKYKILVFYINIPTILYILLMIKLAPLAFKFSSCTIALVFLKL